MDEITEDRRPCTKGCGGQQIFFRGFDATGHLLDNGTAVKGTWQCLKCGHREEQKCPSIPPASSPAAYMDLQR